MLEIVLFNEKFEKQKIFGWFFDVKALLGDVAKFTLYFTKILSELGHIHYMKS
jgi:hypothetical protein